MLSHALLLTLWIDELMFVKFTEVDESILELKK